MCVSQLDYVLVCACVIVMTCLCHVCHCIFVSVTIIILHVCVHACVCVCVVGGWRVVVTFCYYSCENGSLQGRLWTGRHVSLQEMLMLL